jgi:predicted O-methyltransferase YrrM
MFRASHPNNPHKPCTAKWYAREIKYFFGGWQVRYKHAVGLQVWPTKCYEFWLILQQLLYLIKPQTIVEFGAGRSTNYIAEYINKSGGTFISFEQHLYYYFRFNLALSFLFLPWGIVRHAPIKGDWYDEKSVSKNLRGITNIDFLFYDGPTAASKGKRDSKKFFSIISNFLNDVKIIVIDDVQRPPENRIAQTLQDKYHLKRYEVFSICGHTRIAILLNQEAAEKVTLLPSYLQKYLEK